MIKPISPDQVNPVKPDEVIETFNKSVQYHWDGQKAKFLARNVAIEIATRMGISESEVLEKHYLDIEEIYHQAGWEVTYTKPDYNEAIPFEPYFVFTKAAERK